VRALEFLIPFLYPFIPQTAESMASQLGLSPQLRGRKLVLRQLAPGLEIAKGKSLFPKLVTVSDKASVSDFSNAQLVPPAKTEANTQGAATVTKNQQPTAIPESSTAASTPTPSASFATAQPAAHPSQITI